MEWLDFVKEIGNKLFNRDEDAAEKIRRHIEAVNPGITGLGGLLGNILGEAGQAVRGNRNLALGGLGALAGASSENFRNPAWTTRPGNFF